MSKDTVQNGDQGLDRVGILAKNILEELHDVKVDLSYLSIFVLDGLSRVGYGLSKNRAMQLFGLAGLFMVNTESIIGSAGKALEYGESERASAEKAGHVFHVSAEDAVKKYGIGTMEVTDGENVDTDRNIELKRSFFQSGEKIKWAENYGIKEYDEIKYVHPGDDPLMDRMFEIAAFTASSGDDPKTIDINTMSAIQFVDHMSATSTRDGRAVTRTLLGPNKSILFGTDSTDQSWAIFSDNAQNEAEGLDLSTKVHVFVKVYKSESNPNVLEYKVEGGDAVPLVTVTSEGNLEVMMPTYGGGFEAAVVGGSG